MDKKLAFSSVSNKTVSDYIIDRRFTIITLTAFKEYKVITETLYNSAIEKEDDIIVGSMEKAKEECERRFYSFKANVFAEFSKSHFFKRELEFPYLDSEIIRENGKSKVIFKYVNEICTTEISREVYQYLLYSGYMEKTKIMTVFHQLQEEPKNWVYEETIGLKK